MRCYVLKKKKKKINHIIVFSLGTSFPIVLSDGEDNNRMEEGHIILRAECCALDLLPA